MNSQDWETKTCLFCILPLLAYCVTILGYFSSVGVMLFFGGLSVVSETGLFGHDISVHKQLITFVYLNDCRQRNVNLAGVIPTPLRSHDCD